MRLLFVYKRNPQDPCEAALRRWLPRAGVDLAVFRVLPAERSRSSVPQNDGLWDRLRSMVERFKPTHALIWVPYLTEREVAWLRSQGVRVALAINGAASFTSGVERDQRRYFDLLSRLDWYFVPHAPHVPILRQRGVNALEMPYFYDPAVYRPLPSWMRGYGVRGHDLIFIGNFGPQGNLQRPHREGLVRILGERFRLRLLSDHRVNAARIQWRPALTNSHRLNWLMNRGHIALNFDYFPDMTDYDSLMTNHVVSYDPEDRYSIRSRMFTAMGAGVAVLSERHAEVERFFADGRDIVLWGSTEEAVERVEHLLARPKELESIAAEGHATVSRRHTAPVRIGQLLAVMRGEATNQNFVASQGVRALG